MHHSISHIHLLHDQKGRPMVKRVATLRLHRTRGNEKTSKDKGTDEVHPIFSRTRRWEGRAQTKGHAGTPRMTWSTESTREQESSWGIFHGKKQRKETTTINPITNEPSLQEDPHALPTPQNCLPIMPSFIQDCNPLHPQAQFILQQMGYSNR